MIHTLRILYVKDCTLTPESVHRALAAGLDPFDLQVARNRAEFEGQLASHRWDLVLSGYQPPGFDRLEIVDVVRAANARLALLIFTEHGQEAIAAEALKRGATDYFIRHAEPMLRLPEVARAAMARQRDVMSASELQAVVEAADDGILVLSADGRVIHSNQRARTLWKLPVHMAESTDFGALQLLVAEQLVDPAGFIEAARHSLRSNASAAMTLGFLDGRVVERHVHPQMLGDKRLGWVISYRDITASVRVQKELQAAIALQQATLDATADGILVVNPQGRVVGSNRKFQELWRVPDALMDAGDDAQIIAAVLDQLVDPGAFIGMVESLYATPEASSRDVLQFRDGRVFDRYSHPQLADGVPVGRVWSFRDITAIKAVETALRGSEARFRLMFEQTADALMILDAVKGRFLDCNQAAVELFFCTDKQEILALHPSELSPPHQPDGRASLEKAEAMIGLAIREGSHRFEWMHCSSKRAPFTAEVLLTPFMSGQQNLVIATLRDISSRKHQERTQQAVLEISQAAQSTETLEELYPRIHQIVSGLLPARNFYVAIRDEKRGEITFPYYEDEFDPNPGVMKTSDGTITAWLIEQGEAKLFTPESTNEGVLEELPFVGTGSLDWLGVPLKSKSRTLGALVVQSYDGSVRYTEADRVLLEFVSSQVAAAIERKTAEINLRESEARLEEAQHLAHLGSWEWDIPGNVCTWSDELFRIFGVSPEHHQVSLRDSLERIHPDDHVSVRSMMARAFKECRPFRLETRIIRPDGEIRHLHNEVEVRVDASGRVASMVGACLDISARKLEEGVERDRRQVLEQVAKNEPLQEVLGGVVSMLERQIPGSRCTVLILRDGRLYDGSSLHIPKAYSSALEGLPIGPAVGSCGTACYTNKTVIVEDIASDPLWDGYRDVALPHGLRACWSMPIPSSDGGALGSFAVYLDHPCAPSAAELDFLTAASRLAAVAIEHRLLTDRLAHQGQHDALTGLPNRLLLQDRLGQALALAQRKQHQVAVLFMDLDHFKQINDTLGHSHGDILLREVAHRLEGCVRKSDTLARLGGDEFMVVLPELDNAQDAMHVASKLIECLREPFRVEQHEFVVSVSLGISIYPADGQTADTLMANADAAMYRAKETGRDNCMWFTPQMNTRMMERVELESQLRHALVLGQLSLHYQPLCGASGEIKGFEALLRWQHPTLGMVSPGRFIPIAEESGLIVPMGAWVLHEACARTAAWHRAGYTDLSISVNVSAVQFRRGNLLEVVQRVLQETGLEPTALVLEITESLLLQNAADASVNLSELRKLGVGVAIDDFGTGYSSLSYLHKLPVTTLKIDQSFVCEIGTPSPDGREEAPIIRTIIALARNLGLTVVAEGVETAAQFNLLKTLDCDTYQGFLLHRPLTADAANDLLVRLR
ncbi:EAL domain-containing protein [Rhodanobacter sp. AS-Z3]|uniref:EAL domain-containing protein n=1 Tax=Rhodanobacter sp. AS-Z3 TaxID=3031330 RepID=UPI002479087F|nr:EAL domain-containing protein [Rhodanobacter sp. AS-Z3]WEN15079.1 EAL domain-containing protein [Rhodanobacter sp. AS-Z3]